MKKRTIFFFVFIVLMPRLLAQTDTQQVLQEAKKFRFLSPQQQDIVKEGLFFAPWPILSYDQDKGWQIGAMLYVYDFGNGNSYPSPRQQWAIEASYYHKGSQQYTLKYDTKHLIPKVRLSVAATLNYDQAANFYGFNGYMTKYDYAGIKLWTKQKDKTGLPMEYNPIFYRVEKMNFALKVDFSGNIIGKHFFWQAGYCLGWYKWSSVDRKKINKGKSADRVFDGNTLYDYFNLWGIIPSEEQKGGFSSAIRLGLMYDSRDVEMAPNKGLWAEGHLRLAPHFLGTTHSYYAYFLSVRHYIAIVNDVLTFAYRLNYKGTIGKYIPYYMMSIWSVFGQETDKEGLGGYRTVRGLLRNRVQGLDVAFFNAELRWKMFKFQLWKQNWCVAINAFCDGGLVTRKYNISYKGTINSTIIEKYNEYVNQTQKESLHLAAGGGAKLIINQNFILAIDYAQPFKKQDGGACFYLNTGFLF